MHAGDTVLRVWMTRTLSLDSLLSKLNSGSHLRSFEERENGVETAFQRIKEVKSSATSSRTSHVPKLFEKSGEQDSLSHRVRMEARNRFLEKTRLEIAEPLDANKLLQDFRDKSSAKQSHLEVIDFANFREVGEHQPPHLRKYFSPDTFFKLPRDNYGCVSITQLMSIVPQMVHSRTIRLELSFYDLLGQGSLREKEMENYVFKLLPTLPQLRALQDAFYPFYVFTAVRRFFFFLDLHRRGGVRIHHLVLSDVMADFVKMRIYGLYLELDRDQNGTLSQIELSAYAAGVLSSEFISRLFQEYQTYDGEMDYRAFLDFVLAMENKNSTAALYYVWRVLDISKTGRLTAFDIRQLYASVKKILVARDCDTGVPPEDVVDEIFDMAVPANPEYITFEDLMACGQGSKIALILIDAQAFWEHEHREQLAADGDADD